MTPDEIMRAVLRTVPIDYRVLDMLQITMLGPDAAEIKARADGEWYQNIVSISELAA